MNFGEKLMTSVSSHVEKAVLCIKKPQSKVLDKGIETIGLNFMADNKSLQKKLAAYGATKTSGLTSGAEIEQIANSSGYHVFRVQYNPSSIHISSTATQIEKDKMPSENGQPVVCQPMGDSKTEMSFQLIFDKVNTSDAFMHDRFQNTSIGGAITAAGAIVNDYSVKAEVEALIGTLMHPQCRSVVFFWNQMSFEGELTEVKAEFTMFNLTGHPIRATVNLKIEQISEGSLVDEAYWEDALGSLHNLRTGDAQKYINNILNLR